MKTRKALILLGFVAASLRGQVEFSGFYLTSNEALFILSEKNNGVSSGWLKIGESFDAYTIKSFDREKEVIAIERPVCHADRLCVGVSVAVLTSPPRR